MQDDRVFIGVYSTGLSYADRKREVGGDYARLAFLCFSTLDLTFNKGCPEELRAYITQDAAKVQARRGESYQISGCGHTVTLGDKK